MKIRLSINGRGTEMDVDRNASLLHALRAAGLWSVKHGCESGDCGACAVLMDGRLVNSCALLAVQAAGKRIVTAEGLGSLADQGWKTTLGLHPLQDAFVEVGAIQCGYCTPAMVLAAKELLDSRGYSAGESPQPLTEAEVREALSGVLCRCTGYVKPVQAVLRAASRLRGEEPPALEARPIAVDLSPRSDDMHGPRTGSTPGASPEAMSVLARTLPTLRVTPQAAEYQAVGQPAPKVDGPKLVQGKPAFTDDIELRGMLVAKVLYSPVAHARIRRIDAGRARRLPGVAAVLTYQDLPRVVYSTAGQSDPIPGPLDMFSLELQSPIRRGSSGLRRGRKRGHCARGPEPDPR